MSVFIFLCLPMFAGPCGACQAAAPMVAAAPGAERTFEDEADIPAHPRGGLAGSSGFVPVSSTSPQRRDWVWKLEGCHPVLTDGRWVVLGYYHTYMEMVIAKRLAEGRGYRVRVTERI
jgi:hypothetical protein